MKKIHALVVAAIMLSAAASESQEIYSQWAHSQNIIINTSSSGYAISTDIYNFPYLIRLLGGDIPFNEVKKNGDDIRFASAGGTHLSYEIEKWDSAANSAAVWVKVDTILGNNATQFMRMYWGKSDANTQSNGAAVFDTARNFVAVWHFGSDSLNDATANANSGTDHSSLLANGLIGNCRGFGGGYIDFGNKNCFKIGSYITVTGWLKSSQPSGWASIVRHDGHFTAFQADDGGNAHIALWNPNLNTSASWSWADWNDGKWHFFASRFHTTSGVTVLRDGTAYVSAPAITGTLATTTTAPFVVGATETGGENYSGLLDEVVVSNTVRSDAWIKLCYLNQHLVVNTLPTIKYPVRDIVVLNGDILNPVAPALSGIIDSITITPSSMPDYLVFNRSTGAISGWAQALMPRTTYYVRAYNERGFTEDTITLAVVDAIPVVSGEMKNRRGTEPELLGVSVARQPAIFFYVPSPAGVEALQFRLYDCKGTCVWSWNAAVSGLKGGAQSIRIGKTAGGKLPSGVYIVEMRSTATSGRTTTSMSSVMVP